MRLIGKSKSLVAKTLTLRIWIIKESYRNVIILRYTNSKWLTSNTQTEIIDFITVKKTDATGWCPHLVKFMTIYGLIVKKGHSCVPMAAAEVSHKLAIVTNTSNKFINRSKNIHASFAIKNSRKNIIGRRMKNRRCQNRTKDNWNNYKNSNYPMIYLKTEYVKFLNSLKKSNKIFKYNSSFFWLFEFLKN